MAASKFSPATEKIYQRFFASDYKLQDKWKHYSKDEILQYLEIRQKSFMQANIDKSLQGLTDLIHSNPNELSDSDRKLQFNAWRDIATIMGVSPGNSQSQFVVNLTQINASENPMVRELVRKHVDTLKQFAPKMIEHDVIDAEEGSGDDAQARDRS